MSSRPHDADAVFHAIYLVPLCNDTHAHTHTCTCTHTHTGPQEYSRIMNYVKCSACKEDVSCFVSRAYVCACCVRVAASC